MPPTPVTAGGRAPGRRRRWLPRTGPKATWPAKARLAGQAAVFVTTVLLVLGFLLVRYSPERFLRLVDVYRSLPVAVVAVALVSGVCYFALDTVRLLIMAHLPVRDRLRRRLLLGTLGLWLVLTVAAAVAICWYPAAALFGGTG